MHRFLCLITLVLFLSCSSEKPAEVDTQSPSDAGSTKEAGTFASPGTADKGPYSLEIIPADASRSSTLTLMPKGFSLSDAEIEWLVNGSPVTGTAASHFKAMDTEKGDDVRARAVLDGEEILSDSIKIKNAPPEITKVKILPEVFKPGDKLSVDVTGSDIDGDEVTITYEWTKNFESAGNEKQIDVPLKRGDKFSVKITPFDGETYGRPIILRREILNMPPMITEDKDSDFDGKVYTYQVKAADPDGDPLTYSLKTAPDGMTINKDTGLIQWNVPPDFSGKTSINVSVTDGRGGEAAQNFVLEITPEF